ncbi:Uncharacterized membrane protein YebE, DUF533 family [Mesorhizobium albiziae]|uniref:Uncharacterized membrane protein YebE, DUF533 family n=1 Tax=Neomesorhizobium albiziae TaxID=335020 RepID=A0A1I4CHL1_9HYPH|nr:tellurite resistance TerB family protein [Mesorhizobium albiziae]GLS29265.1 protein YebE [Mesorhizobium albiziae]SFK80732.1 Uncharacterized membrane protein YebE, DUF533 family [Mesorhizobium albiziae]
MASNQSVLEQMLEAALRGNGLREKDAGASPAKAAAGGPGNLGDILGSLLGGAAGGRDTATSRAAPGGSGGLGDILGSILGGATDSTGGPDLGTRGGERIPAEPRSSPGSHQQQAEMPQGAGVNNLARYGGMAVIGVLAYQALKRYQAQQGAESGQKAPGTAAAAAMVPPPDSGFHPGQASGGADALAGLLVKAMVASTQADGVIDEDEQRRFAGRLDQLGMSSADRRALAEQLTTPVDPREIVNAANSSELRLQAYAASVLAVAVDTPAERNYLDRLASALGIDPGLKAQVEQTLGRA